MLCLKPMVTWLSGLRMRQPRPTKLKAQLQTAWIGCIGNLRGLNCNISSNNNSRSSSILPKSHQPTDLMKKIAAVAMAQPVYMRYEAAVTGQSPAHLKEARLLPAAEHRAKPSQLQPVIVQELMQQIVLLSSSKDFLCPCCKPKCCISSCQQPVFSWFAA